MHFNKDELYYPIRDEDTTFHIALFHSDKVLPASFRQEAGYFGEVRSEYLKMVYNNVDLALLAHIHVPLGIRKYNNTTMIVPGSASVTNNDDREKHRFVDLPIITIYDNNKVTLEFQRFSTHMEMLQFHKTSENKATPTLGENLMKSKPSPKEVFTEEIKASKNLEEFLINKGYTGRYINLVDKASLGTLDYNKVRQILLGGD